MRRAVGRLGGIRPGALEFTDHLLLYKFADGLERIIGRIIDINFHLITAGGGAPPSDYYASFVELGRLGVLEPAFAQRLAPSAGLRNRLVHEYDEVDPVKLHEACRAATVDVPRYLRSVDTWMSDPVRRQGDRPAR